MTNSEKTEKILMDRGFVHMDGSTLFDKASEMAAGYRSFGHETTITAEKIGRVVWYTVWVRWQEEE